MKWIKPGGFAPYSTFLVDIDIPLDVEGAVKEDVNSIQLDPGGPLALGIPYTTIDLDGYKFEVKRYTIEEILHRMSKASEPLPGLRLFSIYLKQDVVMTVTLFDKLWNKLKSMADDAETMNESLDVALLETKISEHPNIDTGIKKEMPEE